MIMIVIPVMPSVTVFPIDSSSVLTNFPLLVANLLIVFPGFALIALAELVIPLLS